MSSTRFVPTRPFEPAAAIPGPHAQTLMGVLLRPARCPPLVRERWDTDDGDFVDVDILPGPKDGPWLIAFHGLEGSARSGYILAMLRGAQERGWGAVALNFRSCSGEMNRALYSYSSGDTRDALYVIQRIRERISGPLLGIGFSLGGNVLVKLMGETQDACLLHAGVAVSVPYDMLLCARALDGRNAWSWLYRTAFLTTLRRKALAKARLHPGKLNVERIRAVQGFQAFDDAVTAPMYGFADSVEYYTRCSSGQFVSRIRRPTLLITSEDDPLIPGGAVPPDAARNSCVSLAITRRGGHVGFIDGSVTRPRFWAEEQALAFFDHQL